MAKPRILVVGGAASVSAAIIAALSELAHVEVVPHDAPVEPARDAPTPLEYHEHFVLAEPREVRWPHGGYGPPRLGKRGKVLRW